VIETFYGAQHPRAADALRAAPFASLGLALGAADAPR